MWLALGDAVHVGGERGGADEHVADADLAAAVALAVEAGEALDEGARELDLAAHEDAVPGHEDVVEDHQRFLTAEAGVADVEVVVLELARVAALATVDVRDAGRVGRAGEADREVLVAFAHGHRRHDDDLVRVAGAGLVSLGAAHDDAVVTLLDDVHVHVGVRLLMRRQAAVALGVGHGPVRHEILVLQVLYVLLEALVVVGAPGLIGLVGDRVEGVDRVHPDTALEARACLLAEQALHLDLLGEVVGRLVDVGEAVDLLAGEVTGGQHEVFVLGLPRQLVGHGDAVDAGADDGMVDVVVDLLTEEVDLQVQIGEGLDELLGRLETHASHSFLAPVRTPRWPVRARARA